MQLFEPIKPFPKVISNSFFGNTANALFQSDESNLLRIKDIVLVLAVNEKLKYLEKVKIYHNIDFKTKIAC